MNFRRRLQEIRCLSPVCPRQRKALHPWQPRCEAGNIIDYDPPHRVGEIDRLQRVALRRSRHCAQGTARQLRALRRVCGQQIGVHLCLRSRGARCWPARRPTRLPPTREFIDPHVHVWKHDPAFPFADGARVPERDAAPETLLALMKANGVARTVIIQVIHYRYDNRYLASVLKRYPGTFQGVCRVDPLDVEAPDHLSQSDCAGLSRRAPQSGRQRERRLVSRPAHAPIVEAMPGTQGADDRAGADHAHAGSRGRCSRNCRTSRW